MTTRMMTALQLTVARAMMTARRTMTMIRTTTATTVALARTVTVRHELDDREVLEAQVLRDHRGARGLHALDEEAHADADQDGEDGDEHDQAPAARRPESILADRMPVAKTPMAKMNPLTESWVMPEMMWPLVQPPATRAPNTIRNPPMNASR